MHGNLHEAETRLNLARQTLARVQQAENRAGVIQAKARLSETEANLRRTQRLIELGAAAGKDLTAAETAQASAKAEYDFQNNISINREVQEARSAVETAQSEVGHLRNSVAALGAAVPLDDSGRSAHDTSVVTLRAPISGIVTERLINAGAGVEPGKHLLTIADISTLWVIANVPEGQISALRVGTPAEISHPELGTRVSTGQVAFVDPVLNEETRTGRVRVEIRNPGERLKIGMFVEVSFETSTSKADNEASTVIVVPDAAVQRMGDRAIVFIPSSAKPGEFEVRDVEPGEAMDGIHQIRSGLRPGERVVTKGSFTLKTQLLKAQLGDE
jgi:RND family efflux transporter MFP subunit